MYIKVQVFAKTNILSSIVLHSEAVTHTHAHTHTSIKLQLLQLFPYTRFGLNVKRASNAAFVALQLPMTWTTTRLQQQMKIFIRTTKSLLCAHLAHSSVKTATTSPKLTTQTLYFFYATVALTLLLTMPTAITVTTVAAYQ